jgi:hypothetical protein
MLEPNPANHCFGCGGANDSGMKRRSNWTGMRAESPKI